MHRSVAVCVCGCVCGCVCVCVAVCVCGCVCVSCFSPVLCQTALLVCLQTDTTMTDCNGFTELHWLASNGRTQLLNYALQLGLSCDVIDTHGQVRDTEWCVCVWVCVGVCVRVWRPLSQS